MARQGGKISRQLLVITRNFRASGGVRLNESFTASLLSKIPQYGNFEISILSCDYTPQGDREENGFKVTRVPSLFVPQGMPASQFYTELWLGRTKVSLARDVWQRNVDFVRIAKEARKMLSKVEIVHWFDFPSPLISLFTFFSKLSGVKSYITHSTLFKRYPLHYQLFKASSLGFDRVVVTTAALGNSLSERVGLRSDKIQHIPLGTDLSLYQPSVNKGELKEAKGINRDCKVISWFGPIENCMLQDFYFLLDSIQHMQKHLPSSIFIFAFKYGIPSPYVPPAGNVRFHNKLENIREILGITDVVVLPFSNKTWQVGLPLTIIEALASGVPVITKRHPGIDEAIIDGFNGVLVRGNEDIPQAIISLCQQEDRLNEMQRNARAFAEKHFDINKVARAYIDLWST